MLLLATLMAMSAQELPAVSPGTCRVAAERFVAFAPRVRESIMSTSSETDRPGLLAALDADLAKGNEVLTRYRDVKPTAEDASRLDGLRGSMIVEYVKKCADSARAGALPPVAPGLCRMVALRDIQLLAAVTKSLDEDAEAERKGKPHDYTADQRSRMLAIIDGDVKRSSGIAMRYASAKPTEAEMDQAVKMPREDQRLYLEACAA